MSANNRKNSKPKKHRLAISVSERDFELLKLYAASKSITKGKAVKQMLHSEMQKFKSTIGDLPIENQLNLFVAPQTDIFDFIDDDD